MNYAHIQNHPNFHAISQKHFCTDVRTLITESYVRQMDLSSQTAPVGMGNDTNSHSVPMRKQKNCLIRSIDKQLPI